MRVLIKKAHILDSQSPHHGKVRDILIDKGHIVDIKASLNTKADKTLSSAQLYVSPGWVDTFGFYGEPGYEHKETLQTGLESAARGGYTDVAAVPNTLPTVSHASQVEYLLAATRQTFTRLHPLGSITQNIEGKKLAEMLEMQDAGAVAFTDGLRPLQDAGLMLRALEYGLSRDFILLNLPILQALQQQGQMHEGAYSVKYGLPGISPMAETLMVQRDIELASYHDARIHFPAISTAESLSLISAAKKKGIKVSCGVSPMHLVYTDETLSSYNAVYKTMLPLRSAIDQKALRQGLKSGVIDCITSMHLPQNPEAKETDFRDAEPGVIMLQTVLPMLLAAGISLELISDILSHNPSSILGLEPQSIVKDATAKLTVFDPTVEWAFDAKSNASLATNTPVYGQILQGKVIATLNKNKIKINS